MDPLKSNQLEHANISNSSSLDSNIFFNISEAEVYGILKKGLLPENYLAVFIVLYVLLIISSFISNLIICLLVLRRAQIRTPRNLYVVNLAISDLTQCFISMPFTLFRLYNNPELGIFLCKGLPAVEVMNVFVITGTVLAIALDRYFTIVHSSGNAQSRNLVLGTITLIWILAFIFTLPILNYQRVIEDKFFFLETVFRTKKCIEQWPEGYMRATYTFGVMLFQVFIPIFVLAGVHMAIARHLHANIMFQHQIEVCHEESSTNGSHLKKREENHRENLIIATTSFNEECRPLSGSLEGSVGECQPEPQNASSAKETKLTSPSIAVRFNPNLGRCITFKEFCEITPLERTEFTNRSKSNGDAREIQIQVSEDKTRSERANSPCGIIKLKKGKEHKKGFKKKGKDPQSRAERELKRNKRTTMLLLLIAVFFAVSWMPLNMLNLLGDLYPKLIIGSDSYFIIFASCHLVAMSSAVTNAVFYGWLNTNIRRELKEIVSKWSFTRTTAEF